MPESLQVPQHLTLLLGVSVRAAPAPVQCAALQVQRAWKKPVILVFVWK